MACDSAQRFAEAKAKAEEVLQGVGKFLSELVDGSSVGSGANGAIDAQVGDSYRQYSVLRTRHREASLTVAVLALTKSGKSTLLNALIGDTLLPSTNVPETARISTIQHVNLGPTDHPTLTYTSDDGSRKMVEGSCKIYDQLRYLNQEKRSRHHRMSDEALLEIRTRIAALERVGSIPREISMKLLDTPGPNEAGEESLKFQVERVLESVDAVVYLLDYTKLKTQEEADLLKKLRDINPQLFARLSQRLFFCVNKADAIETTEGMEAADTRQYVAQLITKQLQQESFQLKPEQVLLVSARDALLARLVLTNKATQRELEKFRTLAFGRRSVPRSQGQMLAAAEEMFADSGLAGLENSIFAFLYSHSAPLKLMSVVDGAARLLHQVQNVALASQASLQADMATLQAQIQRLQGELSSVLGEFRQLQAEAEEIEGGVVDEVQTRMQTLKERLFQHVTAVLTANEDSVASAVVSSGRWKVVWDKAKRFLPLAGSSGAQSQAALQTTLAELHQDIQDQIGAEVADFWHEVELATNARQQHMFRAVNLHLERLARAVDATVGDLLSLRMEPVLLRMDPPSAAEFHHSLQELFDKGIGTEEVTGVRETQQEYVHWEKRYRGLCRHEYYVGKPAQRTVAEPFRETTYKLDPDRIKAYFMEQVEGRVAASTSYVRAFVHEYVAGRINEARANIEAYATRYSDTMQAALNTQREGEATRVQAVDAVDGHLQRIAELLGQADGLSGHLEELLDAAGPVSSAGDPAAPVSTAAAEQPVLPEGDLVQARGAPAVEQLSQTAELMLLTASQAPAVPTLEDALQLPPALEPVASDEDTISESDATGVDAATYLSEDSFADIAADGHVEAAPANAAHAAPLAASNAEDALGYDVAPALSSSSVSDTSDSESDSDTGSESDSSSSASDIAPQPLVQQALSSASDDDDSTVTDEDSASAYSSSGGDTVAPREVAPAHEAMSATGDAIQRLHDLLGTAFDEERGMDDLAEGGAYPYIGAEMGPAGFASAYSSLDDGGPSPSGEHQPVFEDAVAEEHLLDSRGVQDVAEEPPTAAILPAEFVHMDAGTSAAVEATPEVARNGSDSDGWSVVSDQEA